MSDSPGPQPQSQQPPPQKHTHTISNLTPLPSLGGLDVYSEEAGVDSSLPRNLSSISFGPEACHVEDITSGCGHKHEKNSILHSATHTPAISRDPSRIDVTHASVVSAKGVHEHDLTEMDEGDEGLDDVLEMKAPNTSGRFGTLFEAIPPSSVNPACDLVDLGGAENAQIDPLIAASQTNLATVVTSAPEPTKPVEEQQAVNPNLDAIPPVSDAENINWRFDNMSELQAHITGPDPFEQLRQQAPARSPTLPLVPPHDENSMTAHYDNEKALFNMMASEVATGDGERGVFDSPSAEQGGFFGAPDRAAGDDFFNDSLRSGTIDDNLGVMMGQILDAARADGPDQEAEECVEDENVRFEEGIPLIGHSQESANSEPDLFGDTDVKGDDDFFEGLGISRGNKKFIPELERKSTLQVIGGATHPNHSGTGVAENATVANSQVSGSDNLPDKGKNLLFDVLPSAAEAGEGDFFSQIGQKAPGEEAPKTTEEDDLTARWKAALAEDALEDEDGFLPSDDEGFLPDSDDESSPKPMAPTSEVDGLPSGLSTGNILFAQTQGSGVLQQQPSGRYTPQQSQPPFRPGQLSYGAAAWQQTPPQQMPLNPYAPSQPSQPSSFSPNVTQSYSNQPPVTSPYAAFGARGTQLPGKKVQSFVDKKDGYQSPYDLPLDVALPAIRKRPSNLGLQGPTTPGFPPPPRSSSMGGVSPQIIPSPGAPKPKPKPQQQNFFEELPIAPPKPRTVSAMGLGGQYPPSPANQLPPRSAGGFAPPHSGPPRPSSTQGFYSQSPQQSFSRSVSGSPQQASLPQKPSTASSRYSPALRQASSPYAPPPVPTSAPAMQIYQPPQAVPGPTPNASAPPAPAKYAPRPAGPPQMGRPPTATGGFVAPPKLIESQLPQGGVSPPRKLAQLQGGASPQQVLPTSQFQQPQEDTYSIAQRRFSSDHHSMHSSRPGTARSVSISATMDIPREEEEEAVGDSYASQNNENTASAPPSSQNRYAPSRGPGTPTPGQTILRTNTFTPPPSVSQSPRYTSQIPNRAFSPEATFQPPPRAQTQSPGMAFGRNNKIAQRPRDPYERPSSAFAHTSTYSHSSLDFHQRAQSLQLDFMTPNDEAGRDVLKRWQGAPLFAWGFGGNVAVMFPRRAQRYMSDMQQPMIKCSPGEVKIKNIKEILPLEENQGTFPGPAWIGGRNKGKKKEVLAWMGKKIEALEKETEGNGKRAEEKLLLWKVVRVLLENDGVLEGNPEVERVVRGVLTPEVVSDSDGSVNSGGGSFTMVGDISANMQGPSTERVDPESVRNIKTNLLKGDRTAAVWHAADKRLWSHALLIAGTVGKDLWKQVVQEFVKNEVKTLGEGVESLAVLYEILAGNWAESIDELVSASTRVGVPMLGGAPNGAVNVEEKLDRWRETLGLVLNNRSPGDAEAILALGKLLVSYGRIEAGHICYVFARQGSMGGIGAVLGGHDDPAAHFSLLGTEGGASSALKNTDAIMLTEIYELAVSLAPTPHPAFPHLLSYKLHRAMIRAENGHKSEAQKYVNAIIAVIKGWGKSSVYMNPTFMAAVEELNTRLSFAPKDFSSGPAPTGAGKWIPKLNSETVTSSIWETFNTFVSGEKDDSGGTAEPGGIDPSISGPFARISSESPNMSRVQSGVDLYSAYNANSNYGASAQGGMKPFQQQQQQQHQLPVVAGKYAPQVRNSYESQQSPYTPTANHQQKSPSDSYRPSYTGSGYEPNGNPYEPSGNPYDQKLQQQVNPYYSPHPSSNSANEFGGNPNTYGSRSSFDEAQSSVPATESSFSSAPEIPSYGGYEPPSSGGGYEPPSNEFRPYQPEEDNGDGNNEEIETKPKRRGFMDDDDDDEILKRAEKVKQQAAKKAEEEKKNTAADSGGKKGWFGWFSGKKDPNSSQGPIKAKLGEESSFVYDPDLKRWVNKKAGETIPVAAKPAPPPKRASTPTSASVGMPSRPSFDAPLRSSSSEPPRSPTPAMTPTMPTPSVTPGTPGLSAPPPAFGRSPSPAVMPAKESPPSPSAGLPSGPPSAPLPTSKPPSRPPTAMSSGGGDAMDDLLGPPGANVSRKSTPGVGRKARGKSRYVEVIPGQ